MNKITDIDKTGNVRITKHWGVFVQPMLQRKLNKILHAVGVCFCSLRYPACNAHAS